MIDITALRNLANHGRGAEMTKALHDAADEITRLLEDIHELRAQVDMLEDSLGANAGSKGDFK